MPFTNATVILCKNYIEHPVQRVLDSPVVADGLGQSLHLGRQTADIVVHLIGFLSGHFAMTINHRNGLQAGPLARLDQILRGRSHVILASLLPPVAAFRCLVNPQSRLLKSWWT